MISIIIPFYNAEKYIKKCLESVKNQTFLDYECLMIDDGSTDQSSTIAQKFLNDQRFKLIKKEHIGFPEAKNVGLDAALGEYITFLDADDYWEPQFLELLYSYLIQTNADICCCCYSIFKNDRVMAKKAINSTKFNIHTQDKMRLLLSKFGSSFMWNKLYKKELFKAKRFENVIALSDTLLSYQLFDQAKKVTSISNILINHRIHEESMTAQMQQHNLSYWEHRLNVQIKVLSFLLKNYPDYDYLYHETFLKEWNNIIQYLDPSKVYLYKNKPEVIKLLSAKTNIERLII